jgi:predicted ribosomally synthesized peptide with nif11-like leader
VPWSMSSSSVTMANSQLAALFMAAQEDISLQDKLKSVSSDLELIKIANEAGFSISIEELQELQSDLSDDELQDVAGGVFNAQSEIDNAGKMGTYGYKIMAGITNKAFKDSNIPASFG